MTMESRTKTAVSARAMIVCLLPSNRCYYSHKTYRHHYHASLLLPAPVSCLLVWETSFCGISLFVTWFGFRFEFRTLCLVSNLHVRPQRLYLIQLCDFCIIKCLYSPRVLSAIPHPKACIRILSSQTIEVLILTRKCHIMVWLQRQACLWLYQPTHCTAICLRATFNTWSAASLAFTIALSIVSFMDLLSIVSPDRTSDHVEYSPVHTPVQSGTTYDRHSTINSCTNSYVVLIGYNNQRNLHSSQRVCLVCLVNGFTSELLSLSSPASVLHDRVLTHELSAMLNACDCSKPFSFALAPEAHFNATLSISQPWNC